MNSTDADTLEKLQQTLTKLSMRKANLIDKFFKNGVVVGRFMIQKANLDREIEETQEAIIRNSKRINSRKDT
jgi:hypothetical protein